MPEQTGVVPTTTNAGSAMVDSIVDIMWPGTVVTPSATATTTTDQRRDLVLADVPVGTAILLGNVQGFTQLNHTWTSPPKQVSAESAINPRAGSGNDDGKRWTKFSWETPPPPDQFMKRFWNALFYVSNILTADNIRVLLRGRRCRRRRYRGVNSNSTKNRRYRKMLRATVSIARILQGCWVAAWSLFRGKQNEEGNTTEESCPVAAACQPMATSTAEVLQLPDSPPADVLTPLELLELAGLLPIPPTPLFPEATPVDSRVSGVLMEIPHSTSDDMTMTAPLGAITTWPPSDDSFMVSQHLTSDEMTITAALDDAMAWLSLPSSFAWPSRRQRFEVTDLCQHYDSIAPTGCPSSVVRTTNRMDQLSVVSCATTGRMDVRWIRVTGIELYSSVGHAKVLCIQARSCTASNIVTSFDQVGRHVGRHAVPMPPSRRLKGCYQASAVSRLASMAPLSPRVYPSSPVLTSRGEVAISSSLVVMALPSGRLVTLLNRAFDAVMTATLNPTSWSFYSQSLAVILDLQTDTIKPEGCLAVMDSCRSGNFVPEDGWNGTIRTGFGWWSAGVPMERVDIRWTLVRTVEFPPDVIYAQTLYNQTRPHAECEIAARFDDLDRRQAPTPLQSCRLKFHESCIVSTSPLLPRAPRPSLSLLPPAASLLEASNTRILETPVAPWPPALPTTPLLEAPEAAIISALDAATWSTLANTFTVVDLGQSDSVMPDGGWDYAIQTDVSRLSVACPAERADVRWILQRAAELFPNTGYSQGSDYAAFAIYRGMGGRKEAAVSVFVQWANPTTWFQSSTVDGEYAQLQTGMRHSWEVIQTCSPSIYAWLHSKANASLMLSEMSGDDAMMALYASIFMTAVCSLCTRLRLPTHVIHTIILKTLQAGDGCPAVSLWVVHCLLGIAQAECDRTKDVNEDVCIQARLLIASETVTTFDHLARHAPLPLNYFIDGYRAAMASLPLPAAPWPPLSPSPPASGLGEASNIPLEAPPAPWPSTLSTMPLLEASDLAAATSLDAATWLSLARSFPVTDLRQSDSVMPEGGWGGAIQTDVRRLSGACPAERLDVCWILERAAELYPNTGYSQGADYAALVIYRGMGRDKEATLRVFVQWASPTTWFQSSTIDGQPAQLQKGMRHSWKVLQTRSPFVYAWLHSDANASLMLSELTGDDALIAVYASGLPSHVVCDIISKTLEAGNAGPSVSLWVVHSLLRIAEGDCRRNKDVNADTCIQARLHTAGESVTSFDELDRHAPITLNSFVQGYRAAIAVSV